MTVHLVMPGGYPGDEWMDATARRMSERHGIRHCTLQFEQGSTTHVCALSQP